MLADVIAATLGTPGIDKVAVISPERDVLPRTIPLIYETGGGLNSALMQGIASARTCSVGKVIILPADLPNLVSADVGAMTAALQTNSCVFAPDRHEAGTNGIGIDLKRLGEREFRFHFGADSFARHIKEASDLELPTQVIRTPGLAFDLDEVDDLRMISQTSLAAFAQ